MSKVESHAQVDNTLILSINALLTEGISDLIADETNLMIFAHAVILFDRVAVPIWDIDRPATDYLPSSIAPKGIFENAVDQDFQQRMEYCIERSFVMGSPSKSLSMQSGRSITAALSFVHQILSAEGKAWPSAFQKHVHHMREAHSESVISEIMRILNGYAIDTDYLSLPLEEKVALAYLWRCLYNVTLSIEKQRPYLHNIYRLPFISAIYRHIEEQGLSLPWAEEMPRELKIAESQPMVYKRLLPSLLGSVLSGIETREQVIPRLLEFRENKKARDFRSHYRELQEKLGEPAASVELEKDIEHLIDLWSGFVDPVLIPIRVMYHDFKLEFLMPPSITSWAGRQWTRLSKPHLRFAIHLLEHPEYCKQLNNLMRGTFGSEFRRNSGRKKERTEK